MAKCWICNRKIIPEKVNSIYDQYGHKYYCKEDDCQKRFIEDVGDPPLELDE